MTTEPRIHVLPDPLVKKIAAGEVVERPASVVKELIENAIDAGAQRIAVTIEDGGKQLIRVIDDGCGMTPDELRLSITPHATSKVHAEEDLYSITTMGFRGEALASISSVSRLRIVSRPAESVSGHEIRVAAEQIESAQAAGCPCGTTVEVRDLFFNVPARRKFLKSTSAETGQINEGFLRIGLAHPHIHLELTNNRRRTHNLPVAATRRDRVAGLFGPELASALLPIERAERGIELEAYAAPPAQSRAGPQWQYTYVNGRYIRDRFLQHAIKEAYRGLIDPHRHGVVFLFLTVDPSDVDVNVHPTKIEVRWADSRLVHSLTLSALRETFQSSSLAAPWRVRSPESADHPVDPAMQDRIRREAANALKTQAATYTGPYEAASPSRLGSGFGDERRDNLRAGARGDDQSPSMRRGDRDEIWRSLYRPPDTDSAPQTGDARQLGTPSDSEMDVGGLPRPGHPAPFRSPRAIQMHNLYLVAETEDGIVIVDQHALHERILYEQFRRRLTNGNLESQRLLLPETVSLSARQVSLVDDYASLLQQLGIEATAFGTDTVAVHAFPALLKDTDVADFMRDLLDFLEHQAAEATPDVILDHVLSMMACKAAVKAGDPLSSTEIEALFTQRDLVDKSSSCPHGRPTILRLTKAELERQFKRR